jgi:hypothetical protein
MEELMLIDSFAPDPDAVEIHRMEIAAPSETVYRTLWTADLGGSPVIKGLMMLRSLPSLLLDSKQRVSQSQKVTLQTLIEAGFGQLAEEPGREVVLGIAGRFWRPVGNTVPFSKENFLGPVPPGLARAVWNFTVQETVAGQTMLSTETRVVCGDAASRLKFSLYWMFVRPFSGLIRIIMLRAIRRACEGNN